MSDLLFHGYGDTPSDLYDLSKKWAIDPRRLAFLAKCPTGIHRNFLKEQKDWTAEDKRIAAQCRLAYRQNFTQHEAAEMAKVPLATITAFLARVNVTWPSGCRRKLAWGGGSTLNARRNGGNLLASSIKSTPKRKTSASVEQVLVHGRANGLNLREIAKQSGISYQTLYAATRRLGLVLTKVYSPRQPKGSKR